MAERQLPKLNVAGSIPVSRSRFCISRPVRMQLLLPEPCKRRGPKRRASARYIARKELVDEPGDLRGGLAAIGERLCLWQEGDCFCYLRVP